MTPDQRYWRLLSLIEDFYSGGERTAEDPPPVRFPRPVAERSPAAAIEHQDSLEAVASEVAACRKCGLCQGRTRTVPGEGAAQPRVLVIGEGPGYDEDRSGRPFVGRAGEYLDRWLAAIELRRSENCFITNVVKCRPPHNRDPASEESQACLPFLQRQMRLLEPRAILTVGRIAGQLLTGQTATMARLREETHLYRIAGLAHPGAPGSDLPPQWRAAQSVAAGRGMGRPAPLAEPACRHRRKFHGRRRERRRAPVRRPLTKAD